MSEETNGHILIVDDEDQIRMLLKRRLEKNGFTVEEAENGDAAFTIACNTDFDMIFSDIRMPVLDGLGFIEKLRFQRINTPFVFVSGFGDNSWMLKALRFSAYDFLPKPFDSAQLISIAKRGVEYGKYLRDYREKIKSLNLEPADLEIIYGGFHTAKEFEDEDYD